MSMLAELNAIFESLEIPVETGEFSSEPPVMVEGAVPVLSMWNV